MLHRFLAATKNFVALHTVVFAIAFDADVAQEVVGIGFEASHRDTKDRSRAYQG
jgi:hypothetical protein